MKKIFLVLVIFSLFISVKAQTSFFIKTFGSAGNDAGRSVKQLPGGSIYIAGYSDTALQGKNNFSLSKLDKNGNLMWMKFFGDSLNSIAIYLNETKNGNLILCGQIDVALNNSNGFICKMDTSGNVIWWKSYGGLLNQSLKYIEETADKGFIASGFTSDNSSSNDYYILKTDSLGNQQWTGNYGGSFNDYTSAIHQTTDGGFIVSGDTNSDGAGGYDVEIIRLNSIGSVIWDVLLGDSLNNGSQGILPLKNGGYASYGETETSSNPAFDFFIEKIDSNGNSIFRNTFGGLKSDALFSLVEDDSGGFVFTGYSNSYSSGPLNLVVGKTDSLANLVWINNYGSSGIDIGYEIIAEKDSGFLIVGNTYQNGSDEILLLHVNDSGKVVGLQEKVLNKNILSVFPNPSSGLFEVKSPFLFNEKVVIKIFSIDGKCLFEKTSNIQTNSDLTIDLTKQIENGIYFLKISYLNESYYTRICIQK